MYSRALEGKMLTLIPSGWTYNRTFVLYDKETGSLWYPYKAGLMGIQGEHFEKWLPKLESTDTNWAKWKKANPSTKLMK